MSANIGGKKIEIISLCQREAMHSTCTSMPIVYQAILQLSPCDVTRVYCNWQNLLAKVIFEVSM